VTPRTLAPAVAKKRTATVEPGSTTMGVARSKVTVCGPPPAGTVCWNAALVARHPELVLVAHEARATLWAGGSLHAEFLAQTNARSRGATAPPPDVLARLQIAYAAFNDPTFLYLGELRHQVIARRRE
jgi:hypothetical protein